jgi:hypothetical protein
VRGVKASAKRLFKSIDVKAKIKGSGRARWSLVDHANSPRTDKIIHQRPWDIVLLANSSVGISTTDYDDAIALYEKIILTGASVGFLMTWLEEDKPFSSYDALKGTPGGMFGYVPIAVQLDVPIAPAGWGVRNAIKDSVESGVPFDLWKKAQHLNRNGNYLAGAIVFTTLTQVSPVGLWAPGRFTPEETAYLQTLAADTVLSDLSEWNITPN